MTRRKTVMISSTALDLPKHRDQTRLACEHADFDPKDMMEHLTALDATAVETSLRMVEDADVDVGIFAHRYGTIPKGHDVSITEMEYDRAVELGRRRLVFFAHKEHPFIAADFETGPGAEKLAALKAGIGAERVSAFFKSPEDLRGHVQAALANLKTDSAPTRPPTQGEVLGQFHDLPDDQKQTLLATLKKLYDAPTGGTAGERQETKAAAEEALAGDLTDIKAVLTRRYQKLAVEAASSDKALAEAARDLAAVVSPTSRAQAYALYKEAAERDPDDFWTWIECARAARDCHTVDAAMEAFNRALAVGRSHGDDREIAIAQDAKADIYVRQGNLPEAVRRFIGANAAMARRAAAAPDDLDEQRDLSVSFDRIGDVLSAQGKLDDALARYRDGLAIRERLAAAEPSNTEWQRDVAVSHVKLAGAEPDKTRDHLTRALEIVTELSVGGRLAPADAWMPDDLRRRLADLE